jgi:hypothetical protein
MFVSQKNYFTNKTPTYGAGLALQAAKQKAADCLSQRRVSAGFADFASPKRRRQ